MNDYCREVRSIVNGPQTPKLNQPALELWHKYKFWFNSDVRLAVPAVSIPYGTDLSPWNSKINKTLSLNSQIFTFEDVSTTANSGETASRKITYTPVLSSDRQVTDCKIEAMELYVNNIFVNTEIHDIFIERIGFFSSEFTDIKSAQLITLVLAMLNLNNLKWPIETIYAGVRPTWNVSAANPNLYKDWHSMTYNVDAQYDLKYDIEQVDTSPFRCFPRNHF